MLPRTREAGGTHRIQVIAWQSVLLTGLRHGTLAHRYVSTNPASLNRALRQERCGMRHGAGPAVLLVEVKSVVNE